MVFHAHKMLHLKHKLWLHGTVPAHFFYTSSYKITEQSWMTCSLTEATLLCF